MPALDIDALDTLPRDLHQAITTADLPPLDDGGANPRLAAYLTEFPTLGLTDTVTDDAIALCKSGLWLLAGDLDRSHTISQDLDSAEGSLWHGMMHRREGDFGNAKYWFRRAGDHPMYRQVVHHAPDLPAELQRSGGLDPMAFVDACQAATRGAGGSVDTAACRRVQWVEWQCLFAACLAK